MAEYKIDGRRRKPPARVARVPAKPQARRRSA
jgi:hypothetical protein